MRLPFVFFQSTAGKGRGVFTSKSIAADTIIEIAAVIVMPASDRTHLDQTLLHDYIFEWNSRQGQCCMALGYVPLYNHACPSNCEYEMDYATDLIQIKTIRSVAAGEELLINYHGQFDDPRPLWFRVC